MSKAIDVIWDIMEIIGCVLLCIAMVIAVGIGVTGYFFFVIFCLIAADWKNIATVALIVFAWIAWRFL